MIGIIFGIIAGTAMSVQGVMNTSLSEHSGLFEANTFVQGTAFILSAIIMLIFGNGSFKNLFSVDKIYLLGGVVGVIITVCVMLSIKNLSPTLAISIILISQLVAAALIESFGLLGAEKAPFGLTKYIGTALMIAGVIVFKLK